MAGTAGIGKLTLDWEGDWPVSRDHADGFFAREDGLAESRYVFVEGTRLADLAARGGTVRVAELGFGTGLNCLAALDAVLAAGPPGTTLDYTAFEIAPMAPRDAARALSRWPDMTARAPALHAAARGGPALPGLRLRLIEGDARAEVPRWEGEADAWFLDGFAPSRNAEMWEPALLAAVHARTRPGGRAATYAAAGHVRRALLAAEFRVERRPGFGAKRECLAAERHVRV